MPRKRGAQKKLANDALLPKAPAEGALDPYRYDRGRAGAYPPLAFPGPPAGVYGDGVLSKDQQADAIKLLECALARAKNGFRISPQLVKALEKDIRDFVEAHEDGALINTVHHHVRAGATLTVPFDAGERNNPSAWSGTAFEAVGKMLGMLPQTVSRRYEKAKQKLKPPK